MMPGSAANPARSPERTSYWLWIGPLLFMGCVSLFFVSRFGGLWAEFDSALLTDVIRAFVQEGRLVPGSGEVYFNGYTYQSISTFIIALSGLDVATLQQRIYPFVAVIVVLPAWALYRELTGSARGAAISTILLLTQPEFLFVILRSSHEKFTRTFMLICLFLLVRSVKLRDRPQVFALHVVLFYLVAFALISTNNLLAQSFTLAIVLALVIGWVLERRKACSSRQMSYTLQRLLYVVLTCFVLINIVTFFVYPPVQNNLAIIHNISNRSIAVITDTRTQATNAYAPIITGWINLPTYFLVSSANWITLVASALIWVYHGVRWLWRGRAPATEALWFQWVFFAAFVVQGAFSVVSDAGDASGGNLQHRLFPSFAMIAVAVIGTTLAQWRPRHFPRLIRAGLAAGIFCIAILSMLKATNDPAVSNMWTFYRPDEMMAMEWSDAHLRNTTIWTEFNERLIAAYRTVHSRSAHGNFFIGFALAPDTRTVLVSTINQLRSTRFLFPLPIRPDSFRVYDNGDSQIYRLRPVTPYQR
jgi:hypothetical protein